MWILYSERNIDFKIKDYAIHLVCSMGYILICMETVRPAVKVAATDFGGDINLSLGEQCGGGQMPFILTTGKIFKL